MRSRPVVIAALTVLAITGSGAHADPEAETIECSGVLDATAMTTPGYHVTSGTISCSLGHAGIGYEIYRTFSSSVQANIENRVQATGLSMTYATLYFDQAYHQYSLVIEDENVAGYVAMVNPDDHVRDSGAGPFRYNIRAGFMRSHCNGFCLADTVFGGESFHFVAEYVYDLPVSQ